MKKHSGFTLVELMAVIIVIAIVIAIALPSYSKIKFSIEEKNNQNKQEMIKIAAQKFAEDTNITAVYVKELVDNGYLEADEDGIVYGLNSKHEKININCYVILLERKNGVFYSEILEKDYKNENGLCDYNKLNNLTTDFKIEMYERDTDNKIEYNEDKKYWTKTNVTLKSVFKNKENNEVTWYEGFGDVAIKTCNDKTDGVCVDSLDSKILYVNSDSVLQQNYTAKSIDKDGNPVVARIRVYIDKIAPNFYQNDASKINDKWSSSTIDYKVSAYDNESGLYGYLYVEDFQECPIEREKYQKAKEITFEENGEKTVCLIDNVGNTNKKKLVIDHIDKEPPKCGKVTGDSTIWTNKDRSITVECLDDGSGCKKASYTASFNSSLKTGEITIEDNVGNTTNCPVNVYIDKDKPSCKNTKGASTTWTNKNRKISTECLDSLSGCTMNSYESEFTTDTKVGIITISDNAGNTEDCSVNAYVDKTAPTCESTGAPTSWTNSSVKLVGTCSDSLSGCKGNVTKVINEEKNEDISPGTIYDNAGNSNVCGNQTVKIDKTSPTKPTVNMYKWATNDDTSQPDSNTNLATLVSYTNDSWSNKKVFIKATNSTDALSGVDHYEYTTTGVTSNNTDKKGTNRNIKAQGISYIKYRACDKAGNCSNYTDLYTIKLDWTAPKCGTNTADGANVWHNKAQTISVNCKDEAPSGKNIDVSGCTANSVSKRFTAEGTTGTITLNDNAGNTKDCTVNVYIDKTDPTISCKRYNDSKNSICMKESSELTNNIVCNYKDNLSGMGDRVVKWSGNYESEHNLAARLASGSLSGLTAQDTLCSRSTNVKATFTKLCDRAGNCLRNITKP